MGSPNIQQIQEWLAFMVMCSQLIRYSQQIFYERDRLLGLGDLERAWVYFSPMDPNYSKQLKKRGLMNEFDFGGSYAYSGLLKKTD